jgi:hypothetical protein
MKLRKLLLIVVLGISSLAAADVVTIVDAIETDTSNISFPSTANGRLMFKPCADECDKKFIAAKLTPETKFVVRGQTVDFSDFRSAFLSIRGSGDGYALVSYHVKSGSVVSIIIGI